MEKDFLLLQINDALFPIGAYSHSYGLETYIQKNLVQDGAQAEGFIRRRLKYGFAYNELVSAKLAYEYAKNREINKLLHLEEILEASRISREVREAGRKLGSRFVKTLAGLSIPYENDSYQAYCSQRKGASVTHSVVYGAFCGSAGIGMERAMENYLYAQASSMVTNCVKTIPLSQNEGQRLLFACQELFREILDLLPELGEEDLCLSTPGFDVRCMQHEGLYSRLFMS